MSTSNSPGYAPGQRYQTIPPTPEGLTSKRVIVTHLSPTVELSDLVREIKKATHEMMVREKSSFQLFPGWQVGYGAFTYHISMKPVLISYVLNQEQHHRGISYKDEMIQLLNDNLVPFKEEYLIT